MLIYLNIFEIDGLFKCPTRNATISLLSNNYNSNLFMYHFNHVSSFNEAAWNKNYSECWNVVCHAAELIYVYRSNLGPIDSKYTNDEWLLAKSMQLYWTQFAINNGISPGNGMYNIDWEPFVLGSELSLQLQAADIQMKSNVDVDDSKCKFWDSTGYIWIK